MNFERLELMLYDELGESGAEAVFDAINYYLLNNKVFPCESDKLVLLMMLYCSRYSSCFDRENNAVLRFAVNFPDVTEK